MIKKKRSKPSKQPVTLETLQQQIAELQKQNGKLLKQVTALENRELTTVNCPDCKGRGTDWDYYSPSTCKRCAGYGEVPALSPLGEESCSD